MGGVYAFARTVSSNLRQKDDHYSAAIGGFFAGAIVGLRSKITHQITATSKHI